MHKILNMCNHQIQSVVDIGNNVLDNSPQVPISGCSTQSKLNEIDPAVFKTTVFKVLTVDLAAQPGSQHSQEFL